MTRRQSSDVNFPSFFKAQFRFGYQRPDTAAECCIFTNNETSASSKFEFGCYYQHCRHRHHYSYYDYFYNFFSHYCSSIHFKSEERAKYYKGQAVRRGSRRRVRVRMGGGVKVKVRAKAIPQVKGRILWRETGSGDRRVKVSKIDVEDSDRRDLEQCDVVQGKAGMVLD